MVKDMKGWKRKSEEARSEKQGRGRVRERQCRSVERGPRATTGDADEEWGKTSGVDQETNGHREPSLTSGWPA